MGDTGPGNRPLTSVMVRANEIDAETFAKNCISEMEQILISEWNKKVDDFCKSIKRTEVPTQFDFEKLEFMLHAFKK